MATLRATFMKVGESARAETMSTMPVPELSSATRLTNLTTTSGSLNVQESGSDWVAADDGIVRIYSDGAVNVAAGTNPTAAATAGLYVPANTIVDVSIKSGELLAARNA